MELATLFASFFAVRHVFSLFLAFLLFFFLLYEAAIATRRAMSARILLTIYGSERAYQVIDSCCGSHQNNDDDECFLHFLTFLFVPIPLIYILHSCSLLKSNLIIDESEDTSSYYYADGLDNRSFQSVGAVFALVSSPKKCKYCDDDDKNRFHKFLVANWSCPPFCLSHFLSVSGFSSFGGVRGRLVGFPADTPRRRQARQVPWYRGR